MFSITHSACVKVGDFGVILVGLFLRFSERSLVMGRPLSPPSSSRLISPLENISSSPLESVFAMANLLHTKH